MGAPACSRGREGDPPYPQNPQTRNKNHFGATLGLGTPGTLGLGTPGMSEEETGLNNNPAPRVLKKQSWEAPLGSGFRVCGLGLRIEGLGFGVEGLGFGVEGLGFSTMALRAPLQMWPHVPSSVGYSSIPFKVLG